MHYRFGSSVNLVVTRGTDFSQQVRLTTSRQASATEQLITQRQKCEPPPSFAGLLGIFLPPTANEVAL